ncbi:MAG: polyketide cyclase [Verrucomicrobiaceae bacterium]|nr:MAG: polyketide cyclase [Verrucomicrobiaceae bacterium]
MQQDTLPDSVIHNSRVLPATPGQVFAAFENPDKLAIWWGPAGFTNTFATFEFIPDGNWIFTMHAPNGADFANESVFREIVRDSRIVLEHTVVPWFRLTVTLTPEGQGTLLTWDQEFENPEMAERMRPLAATANEQVLDRLQALLVEN